jgi:hypothetical protein
MDVNRNHVVADIDSVPEEHKGNYTKIPKRLNAEARNFLAGKADGYVDPNKNSELSEWAKKEREKNRAKRKAAKLARKRNRK